MDEIIADWEDHRKTQYAATQIGSDINALQKQIGQKKKAKEPADDIIKQRLQLVEEKKKKEEEAAQKLAALNIKVKSVGNYVHPSVPVSGTEDDNAVLRKWSPEGMGEPKPLEGGLPHHGVLTRLDGWDSDRAVKVSSAPFLFSILSTLTNTDRWAQGLLPYRIRSLPESCARQLRSGVLA